MSFRIKPAHKSLDNGNSEPVPLNIEEIRKMLRKDKTGTVSKNFLLSVQNSQQNSQPKPTSGLAIRTTSSAEQDYR